MHGMIKFKLNLGKFFQRYRKIRRSRAYWVESCVKKDAKMKNTDTKVSVFLMAMLFYLNHIL